MASMGAALSDLGGTMERVMNKEDAFRDQLAIHNYDGEESIRSIKSQQEFNREDPNGWAIEQHTQRQQRFNNMMASLRTDEGRKRAQTYWATRGNNFYEHETSFEYGKRHEVIAKGTESAVASEYAKIDFSGDPDTVVESIKAAQRNSSAVIGAATLPKKDGLYAKSAEHAYNALRRAFTDEKGHIRPEFDDAQKKLLEDLGGATLPPKPGQPAQQFNGQLKEIDRTSSGLRNLGGIKPQGIVFHHTSGTTVDGAIATLSERNLSYNYLIDRDGTVHTIVPPEKGAQHMRPGSNGMSSGNTIGISFVARNDRDVTDAQRAAGRALAARDAQKFGISQNNVFGHGEVNSHKEHDEGKTDAAWIRQNGFGLGVSSRDPKLVQEPTAVPRPMANADYSKAIGILEKRGSLDKATADERKIVNDALRSAGIVDTLVDNGSTGKWYSDAIASVDPKLAAKLKSGAKLTDADHAALRSAGMKSGAIDGLVDNGGGRQWLENEVRKTNPALADKLKAGMTGDQLTPEEHNQLQKHTMSKSDRPQPSLIDMLKQKQAEARSGKRPDHRGILTSLDAPPTPQEVRGANASVLDIDVTKPGAKLAIREAKQNGMKVAAYHEGAGGGPSWREPTRDITKPEELAKLQADAKELAKSGADYLHVDNLSELTPDQLAKVARSVKDAGLTMIGKNNPQGWLDVIQKNPDLKPPYVVIEHGMKDKATIEAARKLSDAGVPVHFVEFGDPGIDMATKQPRKDPTATPDEAKAFAQANPWAAGVTHMKSQDSYNGRSSAGAQTFRAENTIPGAPVRVADASGRIPASAGGNVDPAALRLREILINKQDEFAKERAVAEMRIVGDASASIDQMIDHAKKGGMVGNQMVDDITDKLLKMNPALVAKFGLEEKLTAALDFIDEADAFKSSSIDQQTAHLAQRRSALAANIDKLPANVVAAETDALKRFEELHKATKEGLNNDPISWVRKTGVYEVPPLDWSAAGIQQRIETAEAIAKQYGVAPKYLDEGEREKLSQQLKNGKQGEIIGMLGGMYQSFGPRMLTVMGEISKQAPEAATIGWMVASGNHNQQTIADAAAGLERQQKRALGVEKLPEIKFAEGRKAFLDTLGTSLTKMRQAETSLVETANAIADARAQRLGWEKVTSEEYSKILLEVIGQTSDNNFTYGGLQTYNGFKTVVPPGIKNVGGWPMNNGSLADVMGAINHADVIDSFGTMPMSGNGTPLSLDKIRRMILVPAGDGRYFMAERDPTSADPGYADDGTGKNYVLDLKALTDKVRQRRPDLFKGYVEPRTMLSGPKTDAPTIDSPVPMIPANRFTGDLQHGSDVMQGVQQAAPKNYQPGPAESTNVIDERPSTTYTQGRSGQARQPNQVPMPTADQTPDQLKGLLPN